MQKLEPGLYPGLTRAEYDAIDAVNHSYLKHYGRSAAHARYEMFNPHEPTPAMTIGDAAHAYILEPYRFENEYAVGLDVPRRNKADREAWEEWEEANKGKVPLKPDEFEAIDQMKQAVLRHPIMSAVLEGPGAAELCAVWHDGKTGAACKGLVDRYGQFSNQSVLVDLKTTDDASRDAWARSVVRFGYHTQAAWYLEGFRTLSDVPRRFLFFVVEKKAPHGAAVYELNAEALYQGMYLNEQRLKEHLRCEEEGMYPSYGTHVRILKLPRYALTYLDEEEF